jgi:predicted DsbA family dithiol-disulfide isomerase
MAPEGEGRVEHLGRKYGLDPAQQAANREKLRALGAKVGVEIGTGEGGRIYNTFDAHRLLHWAELQGRQPALKRALLAAYHGRAEDVSNRDVLVAAAQSAGLDAEAAREVLASGRYAEEVREAERVWIRAGVSGVPAVVIGDRYLVSGAQPPEVFEQVIRKALSEAA